MSYHSDIEWTDATWSPLRAKIRPDALEIASVKGYASLIQVLTAVKPNGELRSPPGKVGPHCEHVSPGCEKCYSEANNCRCLPANGTGLPFDRRSRDLVEIFLDEKMLNQPLRWKRPMRIFVNSQTDTFGEFGTDAMVDRMFAVVARCPHHQFQFLTKRADRMRAWAARFDQKSRPLPNCILGVSVENQEWALRRRAALSVVSMFGWKTFVSYEPALGEVNWKGWEFLDWMISGGESGRGARRSEADWHRKTRDWCLENGVSYLFKQWGAWLPDTQNPTMSEEGRKQAGASQAIRVGKHKAGRLLDGRQWNQMPEMLSGSQGPRAAEVRKS